MTLRVALFTGATNENSSTEINCQLQSIYLKHETKFGLSIRGINPRNTKFTKRENEIDVFKLES